MNPVGKKPLNKKAKRTNDPIRIVPLHLRQRNSPIAGDRYWTR
jgi:hypothetical protein